MRRILAGTAAAVLNALARSATAGAQWARRGRRVQAGRVQKYPAARQPAPGRGPRAGRPHTGRQPARARRPLPGAQPAVVQRRDQRTAAPHGQGRTRRRCRLRGWSNAAWALAWGPGSVPPSCAGHSSAASPCRAWSCACRSRWCARPTWPFAKGSGLAGSHLGRALRARVQTRSRQEMSKLQ